MASLFALLSQQTPTLQTRKGLIVVGLQNDFISTPDCKLPVRDTAFLERISELVPAFREHGQVIFVRTEFQQTRPVNGGDTPGDTVVAGGSLGADTEAPSSSGAPSGSRKYQSSASFTEPDHGNNDRELFLSRTSTREPCCVRDTRGAEYAELVQPLIQPMDLHITTTHYSAFGGTSLLLTLRSKLITDVYICGCMTNLSVYATAMDAARFGIEITLVDDCLGYHRRDRHEMAIRQLSDLMDANTVNASKLVARLRGSDVADDEDTNRSQRDHGPSVTLQGQDTILEVDSDEDDEDEVASPIVGISQRLLNHETGRSHSTPLGIYSRSAAERPRFASSQSAKSQIPQPHSGSVERKAETQDGSGSRQKYAKTKVDAASIWSKLSGRDSSEASGLPWLQVIPTGYEPQSSAWQGPTSRDQNLTGSIGGRKSAREEVEERADR